MSLTRKKLSNPVRHLFRKIVDDFFDLCSDSDMLKKKLVTHMMSRSLFREKIIKEIKRTR